MREENFVKMYEGSFREYFDLPALKEYGTDNSYTYGEIAREIAKLHLLFEDVGIRHGEKIAVIGKSSCGWCIAYLATVTYGAVIVPVLQDFNPSDVHHIINHSESTLLFTADSIWDNLEEEKLPNLRAAFSLTDFGLKYEKEGEVVSSIVSRIPDVFAQKYPDFTPKEIQYPEISNDEIAVLNYTSGTTGFSKGVMITGNNLAGNILFAHAIFNLAPGDVMLSFLPLAHTYGAAFEFLYALTAGCTVTLLSKTPSPKILLKAFADTQPALILSVPLILEKIYKNMILPMLAKTPMKVALSLPLLDKTIYAQIRKKLIHAFGGKFIQIIIGGAPLNAEVEDFLRKIDFPMSVGYGMTECAPLISFTLYSENPPAHSCGQVLKCMEARIDSEDPFNIAGEIQVRGRNVMRGYFKNEDATKAIFTEDGWLKTGDLGTLDVDNNIFIRGRSKSVILSANGQNIYPEEVEAKLDNLPFVMESLVVERNGKLVALVYPDYDAIDKNGLHENDLKKAMAQNKETLNKMVAVYERISEIDLYAQEFEKTPKKSIKRYLYK
ncbi:MAG: AMP-binding protein [Candidatus Symbiothrix sp.]|jgi:long-chain acyl-CoA synthetase|nr:AMP-binding protein [Candidatus Symbiothrix sp.]